MVIYMLLQAAQTQPAHDVTFRLMDVVMIVGGVLSIVGSYSLIKTDVSLIKAELVVHNSRFLTNENLMAAHKKELEDENNRIHSRIDSTNLKLEKALQENTQAINNLGLSMQQMEIRLIEKIHEDKN